VTFDAAITTTTNLTSTTSALSSIEGLEYESGTRSISNKKVYKTTIKYLNCVNNETNNDMNDDCTTSSSKT
jgi:hypothetical protein